MCILMVECDNSTHIGIKVLMLILKSFLSPQTFVLPWCYEPLNSSS